LLLTPLYMPHKNNNATEKWAKLCKELEEATGAYEAAETCIACTGELGTENKEALKASLEASRRMTEVLEEIRKLTTRQG
jgi:hypothetical protein